MGYFSNGSEGDIYQNQYCRFCVHNIDYDCQVWLAHLMYNGLKESSKVLDLLIPRSKEGYNLRCTMFMQRDVKRSNKDDLNAKQQP